MIGMLSEGSMICASLTGEGEGSMHGGPFQREVALSEGCLELFFEKVSGICEYRFSGALP